MTEQRTILIVGGAGYVGNVICRRMLDRGWSVRVLDQLIFDHGAAIAPLLEQPGFSFVHGDMRDRATVDRALQGVTDVALLAGLVGDPITKTYPELSQSINLGGCANVLEALASSEINRFVFTSTCSNYGLRTSDEPATEESELAPLSLYAEHKVEMERRILAAAERGVPYVPTVLRISTAYGLSPRMRFDLTISEFTRTLAVGDELVVYDADTWRPYCHVRDIAKAVITTLDADEDDVAGEVFNVGHSDENYTKRMVVDVVQEAIGGDGRVAYEEGGRDPRNYRVSFEKIQRVLGYEPDLRVPISVAAVVEAVRAGAFADYDARLGFYTNHTISGRAIEGAD